MAPEVMRGRHRDGRRFRYRACHRGFSTREADLALFLVRSHHARERLRELHLKHVLATSDDDFDTKFEQLAEELKTTAVLDDVGGELITRMAIEGSASD